MSYLIFMILCIGLRPSRIRPVRCSPIGQHNIARVLIQDMGLVKVLLVPSEAQRQVPAVTPWGACTQRRADLVRRGNAPARAQPGNNGGIESNLGWDKWRWGNIFEESRGLVSIYPLAFLVIPRN